MSIIKVKWKKRLLKGEIGISVPYGVMSLINLKSSHLILLVLFSPAIRSFGPNDIQTGTNDSTYVCNFLQNRQNLKAVFFSLLALLGTRLTEYGEIMVVGWTGVLAWGGRACILLEWNPVPINRHDQFLNSRHDKQNNAHLL